MPFIFDQNTMCPECPFGVCIEDRRANPVRGRTTKFRLKQNTAMHCTFGEFAPGGDNDPDPTRTFDQYLAQFRANAAKAGEILFGTDFDMQPGALAKVEGDVFELIEAAVLWNALATWNQFMDSGTWDSTVFTCPEGAVATPTRRIAALTLPRGYDTTKLFREDVRREVLAFEASMERRGMKLGLSSPDIVGIRLPNPLPPELQPFIEPLNDLTEPNRALLETAYQKLEGTLEGRSFLFALAVKRTTRSDRLYQPLFEANILKFLIEVVLRGAAFRFYVHMGSLEGANVEGHYKAASLISLMRGGEPTKAVDGIFHAETPTGAAQAVLNDLTLFPL